MSKIMRTILLRAAVVIMAIVLIYLTSMFFLNKKETAKSDGMIDVIVIDEKGLEVMHDKLSFYTGDTLLDVLKREYTVTCLAPNQKVDKTCTQTFGFNNNENVIILSINEVNTDFRNTYFAILINGEYSTKGVMQIELKDGDVITFKVEDVR